MDRQWIEPGRARVALVGAGALGLYVGGRLAHSGHDVGFLLRSDAEAVERDGLRIELVDGRELQVKQPRMATRAEQLAPADWVIIGMKTTRNELLPQLLEPLVGPATGILTLQNGLGNVEFLEQAFPGHPVLGVLCQIGVNRESPGYVRSFVPRDGSVQIGAGGHATGEQVAAWCEAFQRAGIRARHAPSLGEATWRKLMWNVPFNGLTIAAGAVATDVVCGDAGLRATARLLMEELRAVAVAKGHVIEEGFSDQLLRFTDEMGAYLSSSVLDWRSGQPVEVDAILRRPLEAGQECGIAMPCLTTVCALVDHLQRQRSQA
jgi:2-dehydropantoate 2-reductase